MTDRQKIVNAAVSYIGCNEANGTHKQIIDLYNSHKPLARGYAVKYTDEWCATFVSAMAIKCGLAGIIPTECGCGQMIALFQKLGAWQENDAYIPKPGDVIFYDWQDTGAGDNTGWSDHVGLVEKVSGSTITVIEGNKGCAVGRRTLAVNGRYIRGYGVPKYKETGSTSTGAAVSSTAKAEAAQQYDKSLAGVYKTTAYLNMRAGAGTDKKIILAIPQGEKVQNYGYYTTINGTKWFYVVYKGETGYCSGKYLKK